MMQRSLAARNASTASANGIVPASCSPSAPKISITAASERRQLLSVRTPLNRCSLSIGRSSLLPAVAAAMLSAICRKVKKPQFLNSCALTSGKTVTQIL
jgi:hypothetical protein